jgi:site-specific DNA recombinase
MWTTSPSARERLPAYLNAVGALGEAEGADRAEAAERLRSLVSKIVLTPEDGRLVIDVHGDLAGILAIAHGKAHRQGPMGLGQAECRQPRPE